LPKAPYHTSRTDPTVKPIKLDFGSFHGSVYTSDRGTCELPPALARTLCSWDLKIVRNPSWFLGIMSFGTLLLFSIAARVGGLGAATLWSEVLGLVVLLATSIFRGFGTSGAERWMIPKRYRRANANYGAVLVGALRSR
jgi:hypothetical protein